MTIAEKCPWCGRRSVPLSTRTAHGKSKAKMYRFKPHLTPGQQQCIGIVEVSGQMFDVWQIKIRKGAK
jgi:hypothetical protein